MKKYGIYFQNTPNDEKERLVVKSMLDLMENDVLFQSELDKLKDEVDIGSNPTDDEVRDMYELYLRFLEVKK
jgi:hypothetical protein